MNGRPLHEQLVRGRSIARDLVARFVAEIPLYQALPREELDGDITRITATNLRIVERVLRTGVPPTEADLGDLAVSAARRAAEGVPLGAVLTAYSIGIRAMWHALLDDASPSDLADVLSATDLVLRFQQTAVSVVATAYAEEHQTISGHERDTRHALVRALLAGEPVADRVLDRYALVVLSLGRHPDEGISARRALRRVQDELRTTLHLLDAHGGVLLLPPDQPVTALVDRLGTVAHATAAYVLADTPDLPAAHRQARDVLDIVVRLGRPPGAYRLEDVLLEYQLGQVTPATAALAALLDPLSDNPDLLPTLELYLAEDLNRRRTAARLHLHPNTVDYRLRRVVALTGLDPARPVDLQRIGAALAARRVLGGKG
ncbi:PucR family transcriptional regulator [Umezawaea endophytica]|uniref:Helix-turn-helix domain-containing protein n=1 Tax=Umezawaea endophytica TaxID=1654476 RepID=A0A9X2VGX9_9PSEU|nr:helix-turn-helix domain-containing protein [Umezawaea endophytica]MCS7476436.1 helix-turn-helix domain-containing protein [Umezawaea endophytica]